MQENLYSQEKAPGAIHSPQWGFAFPVPLFLIALAIILAFFMSPVRQQDEATLSPSIKMSEPLTPSVQHGDHPIVVSPENDRGKGLLSEREGDLQTFSSKTTASTTDETSPRAISPFPLPFSPPQDTPPRPVSVVNATVRPAVVNILCTSKAGGAFRPASGSGVIVDPRGIILTNAHVAQYYLLENYHSPGFIDCIIRAGDTAVPTYRALLFYISQTWIRDNAPDILTDSPRGTGENDYALLHIVGPVTEGGSFSAHLPFLGWDVEDVPDVGDSALLVGYPAGFVGGITTQKGLGLTSTVTRVTDRYTFGAGFVDVLMIDGSLVAQKGSSGGAVVNMRNENLAGIITVATVEETTAIRELRAITLGHIDRSIESELGFGLKKLLSGNLSATRRSFEENVRPVLEEILFKQL